MERKVRNLRNRNELINVRVSQKEKKKLKRNSKNSGLSLSAYLRKSGLKQDIYPIPDKDFYKIYLEIAKLKNEVSDSQMIEKLAQIERNFLSIYNSEKAGDDDGDNENMVDKR